MISVSKILVVYTLEKRDFIKGLIRKSGIFYYTMQIISIIVFFSENQEERSSAVNGEIFLFLNHSSTTADMVSNNIIASTFLKH